MFKLIGERKRKLMNKGERKKKERDSETTDEQVPTVTLLSQRFLAVSSPDSVLLPPWYCPAHTVFLRSPDSLMLLCEFSSPLFLEPGLTWRGEAREE